MMIGGRRLICAARCSAGDGAVKLDAPLATEDRV